MDSSMGLRSLLPPPPLPHPLPLHPADPQAPHPWHALKPLQPLNRLAGTAPQPGNPPIRSWISWEILGKSLDVWIVGNFPEISGLAHGF